MRAEPRDFGEGWRGAVRGLESCRVRQSHYILVLVWLLLLNIWPCSVCHLFMLLCLPLFCHIYIQLPTFWIYWSFPLQHKEHNKKTNLRQSLSLGKIKAKSHPSEINFKLILNRTKVNASPGNSSAVAKLYRLATLLTADKQKRK